MHTTTLNHLTANLLRELATWLSPTDRLNLALSCKKFHTQLYHPHETEHLIATFPLERRFQFKLDVLLPHNKHLYRIVPDRPTQQHILLAVSRHGKFIALLPYDNKLRLINMFTGDVIATRDVSNILQYDLWDVTEGRRKARSPSPDVTYANAAGLDVQPVLEFSANDRTLLLSGPTAVTLLDIQQVQATFRFDLRFQLTVDAAFRHLSIPHPDDALRVPGPAALSPDGLSIASILFTQIPAKVYLAFWDVRTGLCRKLTHVATIHPRRWSALGWARVFYTPNGRYCILVVNAAKKIVRMERVGDRFVRRKLSQFTFSVFDNDSLSADAVIRHSSEWLELSPETYAVQLASCIASILEDLHLHDGSLHAFDGRGCELSTRQKLRLPNLSFNCMHSCPAEATYKALSFGLQSRHPWYVTKQPMFSLQFEMSGRRIQVVKSPHANSIEGLCRRRVEEGDGRATERFQTCEDGGGRQGIRRQAFRKLAWRASFATVTSFSMSGRWLAGASLLDDDVCCVNVRNLTDAEYFL